MGMCLGQGDIEREAERMRVLGLGFTNRVGRDGVLDVCLCLGYGCVGGVWGVVVRWLGGLDQGLEGWCYVCVSCEFGFFVYMSGPGICILC